MSEGKESNWWWVLAAIMLAFGWHYDLGVFGDDDKMTEEEISNQAYYDAIDYCRDQQRKGKKC